MAVATGTQEEKVSKRKTRTALSSKPKSKAGGRATKRATPRARRQAEPQAPQAQPERQSGAEVEFVDGAKRLQDSAHKQVAKSSDDIAKGLVDRAAEGNPACTRMLLDLMAGKTVAPKKLLRALSVAQQLKRDRAWKAPEGQETVTEGPGTGD